jgi:hypothetical protein
MKALVKILLVAIAIPIVGLLFRYETLSPCGMLKTDLRAKAVNDLFELAPASDTHWEMMGQGLGLRMLGPMIDNLVSTLGPWECTKAIYRLKVEGKDVLPKGTAEKVQMKQANLQSEAVQAEREVEEQAKTEKERKEKEEKKAYIPSIDLYGFKAKYFSTYLDGRIPGVEFKLKNKGTRTLRKVEVTVYFKDRSGTVIAEKDYNPVLVTEYSFGGDNKPLKPNYIWQLERGKFLQATSIPAEWAEGNAEARITDIDFLDETRSN